MHRNLNRVNTPKRLTVTLAARQLGVTREHLSRVLHGRRDSKPLLARYSALLKKFTNDK